MDKRKLYILAILYVAFIALGLPDQLLGIAWPTMRAEFNKPLDAAGLSAFLVTIFTSLSGYLNGYIAAKFSVQKILSVSVFLTVIGLFGYAISPNWLIFLLFAIPTGLGAGSVDSVLNNFVSKNYASRHMSWLHAFWGIGSTVGPLIMTGVFAVGMGWRAGYAIVSGILFLMTILFIASKKLWTDSKEEEQNKKKEFKNISSLNTFLSASFFFIYTSTEGGIGLWIYSVMTEARGIEPILAGTLVAIYWGSLTVGRIIIGFVTKKFSDKTIIMTSLLIVLSAMLMLCNPSKITTILGLILAGMGLSGIYPCTMNDTHRRYEEVTADILTGHQVGAASLGFGLITPLLGFVIQRIGLNFLPVILLFFVLYMIIIESRLRKLDNGKYQEI